MQAAVLEPGERPISHSRVRERATRIVLEDISPRECTRLALTGVQLASDGTDGRDKREGPLLDYTGEIPLTRELLITLTPGIGLPFAEGDVICGSVAAFAFSDIMGREALIARPNGDVLLAYAWPMPRDASPAPGWTFTLGPKRTFRAPLNDHDVLVTHGGVSVETRFTGESARLHAMDGDFLVSAKGYVAVGPLSTLNAYLAKSGYGFTIVRAGVGSAGERIGTGR